VPLDVGDPEIRAGAWCADTVDRFGRSTFSSTMPACRSEKPPETYALEEWQSVRQRQPDRHLLCCCQAAHGAMKAAGGGRSSISASNDVDLWRCRTPPAYSASKGAVVQLTKIARHRLGPGRQHPGQRVCAARRIDTELTQEARRQVSGLHERILRRTPGRPLGPPRRSRGHRRVSPPARHPISSPGPDDPVDGGFSVEL
jgi:2-deoxy-D-gluconate 3-dehydrogenase